MDKSNHNDLTVVATTFADKCRRMHLYGTHKIDKQIPENRRVNSVLKTCSIHKDRLADTLINSLRRRNFRGREVQKLLKSSNVAAKQKCCINLDLYLNQNFDQKNDIQTSPVVLKDDDKSNPLNIKIKGISPLTDKFSSRRKCQSKNAKIAEYDRLVKDESKIKILMHDPITID